MTCVVLHPDDDVAMLTAQAQEGDRPLAVGEPLARRLQAGHKLARHAISKGQPIRKFGQVIGLATADIAAGAHVHTHNCGMGGHDDSYSIGADLSAARAAIPDSPPRTFEGYLRPDGRVGTRNMIALVSTVNCSATVIRQAVRAIERAGLLDDYPTVDGIVGVTHGTGCGMAAEGPGWENLQRTLWGTATHPNVAAAIFVGLGCEVMQIARLRAAFGGDGSDRIHGLTIQDSGGTAATVAAITARVAEMLPDLARVQRTPQPLSALTVGLQCGGSDGYSGITANPALGVASDLIVGQGGTVILSETPEIYGAEQLLLRRAASPQVAEALIARLDWWTAYAEMHGGTMDNNPSPGNKAGGLTTILEKSLGAVAKAGSTPLNGVLAYGQQVTDRGLVFMDTPGFDPVSATGQIAGGAQLIVFTTGRGSAFGSKPAPTLKLATNDRLFAQMEGDMDLNCGDIVSQGVSLQDKGAEILDLIVRTASGRASKSEALGLGDHEFLPWQIGAVM
ncbi:altronate dehydratase [Salipiger sp. IMCC34102]|uniref:UxaA family hydrolase n=1 Tax=Salipiger sp. IMCC34102 TaxID=2510647 RepID=UPI00101C7029|nr:altronate dehydratase family protein [Salipiger sp. IMCC34102]RYH03499.1 altronate dehydratase [Salipiger sp. IMCC34102]